jgi:hypothetical protein
VIGLPYCAIKWFELNGFNKDLLFLKDIKKLLCARFVRFLVWVRLSLEASKATIAMRVDSFYCVCFLPDEI